MKNLHLIPTDKPSRFSLNSSGKYHLTNHLYANSPNFTNQNIYITSDEEIQEGDWYIDLFKNEVRKAQLDLFNDKYKKVILTTDQDLIKDGVQAIDDTFLEWFIKNPSCESVEIEKSIDFIKEIHVYKIIIPKEEPKQETIEEAAERLYPFAFGGIGNTENDRKNQFIEGAKSEAARDYWFEQFKKKGGDK